MFGYRKYAATTREYGQPPRTYDGELVTLFGRTIWSRRRRPQAAHEATGPSVVADVIPNAPSVESGGGLATSVEAATKRGLICPALGCGYRQTWAPEIAFRGAIAAPNFSAQHKEPGT